MKAEDTFVMSTKHSAC